jgi:hypothetical protein
METIQKIRNFNLIIKIMTEENVLTGAFIDSLKRNNGKIREDRAIAIGESAQMRYKRKIEDLEMELKQLKRDRDNMMDLSPASADSLVLASDFDAQTFVDKDVQIGITIRNLEIQLEIARDRYNHLFNQTA